MPGVEIIATAIAHLTTGDGILRDRSTRGIDAILAVVLTLLLVGLLAWRRSAVGLISIAVVSRDLDDRQFRRIFARRLA